LVQKKGAQGRVSEKDFGAGGWKKGGGKQLKDRGGQKEKKQGFE